MLRSCRTSSWLLLLLSFFVMPPSTQAACICPFCGAMQGQTLVKEVQQARFVLYGVPSNPQIKRDADGREFSTTDFTIEEVVKPDPFLKNKKTLTLPRYIPPSAAGDEKMLVFCDLSNEQPDTYLMMTIKDVAVVKYLKEAMKIDEKDVSKRLRFYFNYLDHFDNEVASDAYKEFAKADYADVVKLVKDYGDADMRKRLQTWLKDPNTAIYRYGLFGLMLGLCGKSEDGEVFLSLLNDPDKSLISGIDGILAGYILVDQTNGWKYTKSLIMGNTSDFAKRHAGLRTIRFLWDTHMGHIPPDELLGAMEQFISQGDIADMAIDDLRKWKQWKFTDKILEQSKRDTHIGALVQRAVLRYMLSVPHDKYPGAKAYVEAVRKVNPDKIKDAQEILDLEKANEADISKAK
ncbi:MAG TPA: hypothetical protein PLN21_03340 [Gemmatales bacterium]|nr:hypothetical protein [Gemmatales bacterium]